MFKYFEEGRIFDVEFLNVWESYLCVGSYFDVEHMVFDHFFPLFHAHGLSYKYSEFCENISLQYYEIDFIIHDMCIRKIEFIYPVMYRLTVGLGGPQSVSFKRLMA